VPVEAPRPIDHRSGSFDTMTHTTTIPATARREHALWSAPVLVGTVESLAALAGQLAVTDLLPASVGCVVVDAVDHPPDIAGLPVLGNLESLGGLHAGAPFSCAIVSLAAGDAALLSRVRHVLRALAIPERFVPTLTDLLSRPPQANGLSPASLNTTELIGRTPYGIDRRLVREALEGKRVLVTGAGGSIGSEICRIAATFGPSQLIMMERSENALFEIDAQIGRRFPGLARRAILNDVVDADATLRHVVGLAPHAVFHAAAHKHVPLMEDHPAHALSNNLFGTKSIADAAGAAGAERFVMISTDKAVNPSSMMGATKRLAEVYVQWLGGRSDRTRYSIVRFGNVLGSACSVLPIWGQQLAEGGPLTVTDARMTRYFMTIPEAASLVIQAGAMVTGARQPVYILDMGDPVRILDLALRFARQYGYEPVLPGAAPQSGDAPRIDVAITGVRPGEKLHEELAYRAEALERTPHPGIFALHEASPVRDSVPRMLAELGTVRTNPEANAVRAAILRHLSGVIGRTSTENDANVSDVSDPARIAAA